MNRKAIAVYVDSDPRIVEEFSWVYKTWAMNRLDSEYDLLVYHNPSVEGLPDHPCLRAIPTAPLEDLDPKWSGYRFANSFAMFNSVAECEDVLSRYDYVMKTDCDVFLTANLLGHEPEMVMLGRGGYMTSGAEEVLANISRIQASLGLKNNRHANVGASLFGPAAKVVKVVRAHFALTQHILKNEWPDGTVGNWPGWYKGVSSMYAIHLAVNHYLMSKEVRLNALDDLCCGNRITKDVLHIHAWHTDLDFSKHRWHAGGYAASEYSEIPSIASEYCLCVASTPLDRLLALADK